GRAGQRARHPVAQWHRDHPSGPASMIEAYRQLRTARVVGLISGTSADAIDAALVQIEGSSMKLLRFHSHPFPAEVRQLLFDLFEDRATVRQVARAHFVLGELFAEAALAVMQGE